MTDEERQAEQQRKAPPRAADLFLNAWCQAMASDAVHKPGAVNGAFRTQIDFWSRVWLDCLELADALNAGHALGSEATAIVTSGLEYDP